MDINKSNLHEYEEAAYRYFIGFIERERARYQSSEYGGVGYELIYMCSAGHLTHFVA